MGTWGQSYKHTIDLLKQPNDTLRNSIIFQSVRIWDCAYTFFELKYAYFTLFSDIDEPRLAVNIDQGCNRSQNSMFRSFDGSESWITSVGTNGVIFLPLISILYCWENICSPKTQFYFKDIMTALSFIFVKCKSLLNRAQEQKRHLRADVSTSTQTQFEKKELMLERTKSVQARTCLSSRVQF